MENGNSDHPDQCRRTEKMGFHRERVSRRHFLTGLAAGSVGTFSDRKAIAQQAGGGTLPAPEKSGIDHVVLVMMENRSFDHFLGWLPGANGRQAGLRYRSEEHTSELQSQFHLVCRLLLEKKKKRCSPPASSRSRPRYAA